MKALVIFIKDHRVSQKLPIIPKGTIATMTEPPWVKITHLDKDNKATTMLIARIFLKGFLPYPFTVPFDETIRFLSEREISRLRNHHLLMKGKNAMLIPHEALKNMHLRAKKMYVVCRLAGNTCNICFAHIHDGDTVCPKGHRRGEEYFRGRKAFDF